MAAGAEENIWLKAGNGTGVSGTSGRKVPGSLGSTGLDVGKPKVPDVPEIGGKGKSNLVKPTQEGLDTIKKHLSGDMQADFNDAMIARIEKTFKEGGKLEGPDAEFYRHELEEFRLMKQGLDYGTAHTAALDKYGVTEFDLYHPDVIKEMPKLFSPAWFEYWGISL